MLHSNDYLIRRPLAGALGLVAVALMASGPLVEPAQAVVSIDQQPLTVSNDVPGNVVLTPSVEFPTVLSMSNLGAFDPNKTYGGYFDPNKCYGYDPVGAIPTTTPAPQMADPNGETGYFVPMAVSATSPASCNVEDQWSGNYLNWAATQTIDTFRSVMTGGYRVIDTSTLTVLEKARHTGQGGANLGDLGISGNSTVADATPSSFSYFRTRLDDLGNKMYFISADSTSVENCDASDNNCQTKSLDNWLDDPGDAGVVPYDGTIESGQVYSVNVDVQVCKNGLLEANCVAYGSNYKPEGLIQKYAKSLRYSVFGYLNISDDNQDGAALRTAQKFVGPHTYVPGDGEQTNPDAEWGASTGVLVDNPHGAAIGHSGVINYLNKFGQMYSNNLKGLDPVSEMYYAAIRYLKNQDPVASYSLAPGGGIPTAEQKDGFPILTNAVDPITLSCQKNFILGIGDVNTHDDQNLPGSTSHTDEPAGVPPEVSSDTTVNVADALHRLEILEGINIPISPQYSGRDNSAYIAGLAYDSHTQDMRPDLDGMQTVSTYWVDVVENQILEPITRNQYMLAAKYGGFTVPEDYDPYTHTTALPEAWWTTNGDILTANNDDTYKRPDNFFLGGDADAMRRGLSTAFAAIVSEVNGSKASLSLNATQGAGTQYIYRASYVSGAWTGSLQAFEILTNGQVAVTPTWSASLPTYTARDVYTVIGGAYKAFSVANVTGGGWTDDIVEYVLGDPSNEIKNSGTLRNRTSALGDIVHSQPVHVGKPPTFRFGGATFTGSADYSTFVSTKSGRDAVVYVAANDGMLHGFDASTGVETYAFMPGAVLSASTNPSVLSRPNYGSSFNPHQYFNDGQITVAPVYFSSDSNWHTVLVATTGRGTAKAIYALDVTDPANVKFLWEISGATNADIGQILGRPVIARINSGWVALVGNGYNSTNGTAALLSIPLDGSTAPTVTAYVASPATDNGLATPGVWVGNTSTYEATEAYAGDLLGHLWKFDLTSGTVTEVFSTSGKPITVPILLGKNGTSGDLWAYFGTGKQLADADLSDTSVQTWYGIIVSETLPVSAGDLVQREIISQTNGTPADPTTTPPTRAVAPARALSEGSAAEMAGKSGWYMDLVPPGGANKGERILVGNQFVFGYLVATSTVPDVSNLCTPAGKGWVMIVDPFNGAAPEDIFFDLNSNNLFNAEDMIDDGSGNSTAAGGIGFDSLTGQPAFTENAMYNNRNVNGGLGIGSTKINTGTGDLERVSWRELINP